jgi:branched-chain amino acid transport system substrate-binding protein
MTRENRRKFLQRTTAVVAGIGLAGCSSGDGDGDGGDGGTATPTDSDGGTTTLEPNEPFKIGVIQPLSGPYANLGTAQKNGAELAVQDMNANGGIDGREVEMISKDSKLSPETGVQAARELQQEGVDALFGPLLSNVGLAIREFVESAGIPMTSPIYSQSAVAGDTCNEYFYPISGVDSRVLGGATSKSVIQNIDGKRVATITPDYTIGRETWNSFESHFTANRSGATVVDTHFPEIGKGDYQNEIQSVISADADIVQSLLFSQDLISFTQQAKQVDFFEKINAFVLSGTFLDLAESLGEDMVRMYAGLPYYYKFPDTQANRDFVSKYRDQFGKDPHNSGEQGYCNVVAFQQAATEAGGSSADDIVAGLDGLEVQSPGGARQVRAEDNLGINTYIPTGWVEEVPSDSYELAYGMQEVTPIDGTTIPPEVMCG